MNINDKIFLTGHSGFLGKSIHNLLLKRNFSNVITAKSSELDLLNQNKVNKFIFDNKPKYIIHVAAKAGGILANKKFPADFIYKNIMMQSNVFKSALDCRVEKLIFISSTCAYPKEVKQPMKESYILSGKFTPEVAPYSLAKVTGMEMLKAFHEQHGFMSNSVMLPNLYGPGDHYGDLSNHVIPALIERFIKAKIQDLPKIEVWGTGKSIREFLHIDDAADGILYLLENCNIVDPINLSSKTNITIKELAVLIKKLTGYMGEIVFDSTKPEGAPIKISDDKLITSLGWSSKINFEIGLKNSIYDYMSSH